MLSLKDYLVEAKFSEDDLARIISAFERRMPKLLGTQIYRHGGPGASYKVGSQTVIQYYFDDRAFQLRAKGGHVIGIDVWDKYSIDRGPSYTVNVNDLSASSLLGAMTKLAGVIKNPSVGEVQVKNLNESIQLDEMAKRVESASFYQMMVDEYGENEVTSVTWDQIKAVADKNDVLIPAYIRDQKIGRGKWDARVGAGGAEAPAKASKQDPILYIKITAQDPVSKKFITAGDSKQAQDMYSQIQGAISNSRPSEAEVKDPETLYGHLAQLVEMACKGSLRSLLIYGGPGTGKTYTIMKTIQEKGMVKGKDYVKLSGKASPVEIYKTLFMFRDKGLVVFDDLDSMWRNEDATNILKAALDTSPVREISWVSAQTINVGRMSDEQKATLFKQIDKQINGEPLEDDAAGAFDDGDEDEDDGGKKKKKGATSAQTFNPDKLKYPSMFDFTGRVIFISNLKKEEFDTAIMSRSAKINMDMTPQQILARMRNILPTLGGDDVTLTQKEELLDHLLVMHGRKEITSVTMREFTKGLDIVRSGVPNWRDLLVYA